jgi:hypothetical protein
MSRAGEIALLQKGATLHPNKKAERDKYIVSEFYQSARAFSAQEVEIAEKPL